jgi:hypothetical protein
VTAYQLVLQVQGLLLISFAGIRFRRRAVSLTAAGPNPIMPRSLIPFRCKERPHVFHVSTAFKSEEKARTRVSQANEHQERSESLGSAPSQRTSPPDRVARCCKAPSTALSPRFLPRVGKSLTDQMRPGRYRWPRMRLEGKARRERST